MKNLYRQHSFRSSRWATGIVVAAVVALLLIAIKRHRGETSTSTNSHTSSAPGDEHHEHQAPDGEAGDAGDEEVITGGENNAGVEEADGEEIDDEEEYVMLTEEEIGPAIERACASAEFERSSREVQRTWDLLKDTDTEVTCARVQEIFVAKNSGVGALSDEGLSWDGRQEGAIVMISSIIEGSTDAVLLSEIMRLLGEKLFSRGMNESCFQSLGEALLQAVEDALGIDSEPLSSCSVAAWKYFLGTVSACMMLVGASVASRKTAPDNLSLGCKERRFLVGVGWKREEGQLVFRPRRAAVPSPSTATEKRRVHEKMFVEVAGGNRVQM